MLCGSKALIIFNIDFRDCITRSITQKAQCPVCRIPCFKRDIKKNHQLSAIVTSFDKLVAQQKKRKREPEDDEGHEESFFKRPKRHDVRFTMTDDDNDNNLT